jgi:vacuolar-type H+-ATPase subunit C/Vma6
MSNLIHAVSRVRAMESDLVTTTNIERMIFSDSFESAYSVLDDIGFSKESSYFRKDFDFEAVLEMGLYSSFQIFRSFFIGDILKIITFLWDIQNILLFIRSRENNIPIEEVSKIAIPYGYYSIEDLENMVFKSKGEVSIIRLIDKAKKLSVNDRVLFVEDYFFKQSLKISKGNKFLTKYVTFLIDFENCKKDFFMLSDSTLLKKYPIFKDVLLESISKKTKQEKIKLFSFKVETLILNFLLSNSLGKINGYESLISFFWRKERSSKVIRSVLLSKKKNISSKKIKEQYSFIAF